MISSMNKGSTLKPSVMKTCDFVPAQSLIAPKEFCLPNFIHKAWVTHGMAVRHLSKGAGIASHMMSPKILNFCLYISAAFLTSYGLRELVNF